MSDWNEALVATALQKKWGKPEYAFIRQVRNATGLPDRVRTADALAMGLWPSRGLYLHGFEIKVSRSDWAHELKQPDKAEEISRYCHFWWLAVPEASIVKDGELPLPWGLVEVNTGSPKIIKQALFTENPQPPTLTFFASLLRSISEDKTALDDIRTLMQKEMWEAERRGREQAEKIAAKNQSEQGKKLADLQARVNEFEQKSGIRMDRYSDHFNGEIGRAVNFLKNERGIAEAIRFQRERLAVLVDDLVAVENGLAMAKTKAAPVQESLL